MKYTLRIYFFNLAIYFSRLLHALIPITAFYIFYRHTLQAKEQFVDDYNKRKIDSDLKFFNDFIQKKGGEKFIEEINKNDLSVPVPSYSTRGGTPNMDPNLFWGKSNNVPEFDPKKYAKSMMFVDDDEKRKIQNRILEKEHKDYQVFEMNLALQVREGRITVDEYCERLIAFQPGENSGNTTK